MVKVLYVLQLCRERKKKIKREREREEFDSFVSRIARWSRKIIFGSIGKGGQKFELWDFFFFIYLYFLTLSTSYRSSNRFKSLI